VKTLYLIPARGGSKGIPNKNRKLLLGKALIFYSIDVAKELSEAENICVSTDDKNIATLCENYGLSIPFLRPAKYAKYESSTDDVIIHALDFYRKQNKLFDCVVLLQPTSPMRTSKHISEAMKLFSLNVDMVVGVKESKSNPYTVLMEEGNNGYLKKSKKSKIIISRRQDAPHVYEVNGAIYIINVKSFLKKGTLGSLKRIKKHVMPEEVSIDLDTPLDWEIASFLMTKKIAHK